MELLDDLRAQCQSLAAERLGIGDFACAYARELPIQKVGPYFALEHAEAPVADVLEQQQTQHNLRRRSQPSARAAFGMTPQESFIDNMEQFLVFQYLVSPAHPGFPIIADGFCDELFRKAWRRVAEMNHLPRLRPLGSSGSARNNC